MAMKHRGLCRICLRIAFCALLAWVDIPACREKISVRPSEYLPRIYADSVVFSPDVLDLCVRTFGAGNVMYGSDYPHTIGDMPGCLKRVNGLAGDARDKVRGGNARRAFNL